MSTNLTFIINTSQIIEDKRINSDMKLVYESKKF